VFNHLTNKVLGNFSCKVSSMKFHDFLFALFDALTMDIDNEYCY
jgi:hypothetical protein